MKPLFGDRLSLVCASPVFGAGLFVLAGLGTSTACKTSDEADPAEGSESSQSDTDDEVTSTESDESSDSSDIPSDESSGEWSGDSSDELSSTSTQDSSTTSSDECGLRCDFDAADSCPDGLQCENVRTCFRARCRPFGEVGLGGACEDWFDDDPDAPRCGKGLACYYGVCLTRCYAEQSDSCDDSFSCGDEDGPDVCLKKCNPLTPECPPAQPHCWAWYGEYQCRDAIPEANAEWGEKCDFDPDCFEGTVCANGAKVDSEACQAGVGSGSCCAKICDLEATVTCPGPREVCMDSGEVGDGVKVGICLMP
jgi:hypothetical protein